MVSSLYRNNSLLEPLHPKSSPVDSIESLAARMALSDSENRTEFKLGEKTKSEIDKAVEAQKETKYM